MLTVAKVKGSSADAYRQYLESRTAADERGDYYGGINLHAPFRLVRAATAPLAASRGSIVNVSSVNGLRSFQRAA